LLPTGGVERGRGSSSSRPTAAAATVAAAAASFDSLAVDLSATGAAGFSLDEAFSADLSVAEEVLADEGPAVLADRL